MKEQLNLNLIFSKGSQNLYETIDVHFCPLIKIGLGYNANQNDETLESMKSFEAGTRSYGNALKGSNCQESKREAISKRVNLNKRKKDQAIVR